MKTRTIVTKSLESSMLLSRNKDSNMDLFNSQQVIPLKEELQKQIDTFSKDADGDIKVTIKTEYVSSKKEVDI